jgi:hypothetical protein
MSRKKKFKENEVEGRIKTLEKDGFDGEQIRQFLGAIEFFKNQYSLFIKEKEVLSKVIKLSVTQIDLLGTLVSFPTYRNAIEDFKKIKSKLTEALDECQAQIWQYPPLNKGLKKPPTDQADLELLALIEYLAKGYKDGFEVCGNWLKTEALKKGNLLVPKEKWDPKFKIKKRKISDYFARALMAVSDLTGDTPEHLKKKCSKIRKKFHLKPSFRRYPFNPKNPD